MPAAAKAAAKGAASSQGDTLDSKGEGDLLDSKEEGDLLDSKEEQGSPHDSKEKQVSPHNEEEGDLQATRPRVRTGYDTATPTGYDTEGAASRAEDDTEEEAETPQKKPAAKLVKVTVAHADGVVQGLPSQLHPPQKLNDGG